MRRLLIAGAAIGVVAAGAVLSAPGHVSAHSPEYSLSCAGATLRGFGYEEQHTNMATIFIDGAVVFHVDDFGTDLDETVAVPQDGVVHTVRLVIDAQGPGTEGHPEYDLDVTDTVGPCGEATTTTTATTTSTSTTTTTSTSTTTTMPATTTTAPTAGQFSVSAVAICSDGEPLIAITFPSRPDLDGQTGTLAFSTGGSVSLTFVSGTTVQVPYPGTTGDVTLTYTLGAETATATVSFPENCSVATTTTTEPGVTTTTTEPGATTTTTEPGATTTTTEPGATTTTTEPGATTTTVPGTLSIAAFSPICMQDAPYIDVTFGDQPEFNGQTATVTFIDVDGNVVGTHTTTYEAGATRRFIYPGASVDASGNPLDWPGWMFDGDEWVVDPTDAHLREGLTVVVEVNPTATGTVSYPPETPTCSANPPAPGEPPTAPGGHLPTTGGGSTPLLPIATLLLAGGATAIVVTRRRTAGSRESG